MSKELLLPCMHEPNDHVVVKFTSPDEGPEISLEVSKRSLDQGDLKVFLTREQGIALTKALVNWMGDYK